MAAALIRFEFIGESYDWAVQQMGLNERHATPAELWDFLETFGFQAGADPAANAAAIDSLYESFPPTHFMVQPNYRWLLLGTASEGDIFNLSLEYLWDDELGDMTWHGYAWTGGPVLPPDMGNELYGHWIIATVPEPAVAALLAGLAALAAIGWRRRAPRCRLPG